MRIFSSFFVDATRIAGQSIAAHKLRAVLTLIGIVIGVASVVTVGASISGLNSYIVDKISKLLGNNHFMIARMAFSGRLSDEEFERVNRRNKRLEWEDYEWVRDNCAMCAEVGAQVGGNLDLRQDGVDLPSVKVFGITANIMEIVSKDMEEGRYFSDDEVERAAPVVILAGDVKDKYFPDGSALGRTLKIAGRPMLVVGVTARAGTFFGDSLDRELFVPITVARQIFGRNGLQIHGKGRDRDTFPQAMEDARIALRVKHKLKGNEDDDFGLVNTDELNGQIGQFTNAIAAVVIPITLITLIVGGIVVMNIMLVSVTERTFEVGLRKALGATKRQILLQFLIESVLLCAVGGLLGLGLAFVVTKIITATAEIVMTITLGYILLAIIVSSVIGIVAGLYPAFKAARLDPILALMKS
jgi:putative ABC transport system permease protein